MHITQLRIAGFKSFVDPTDVPIEPGLTGIVGPNGCGKSNFLESLRWVMGASSARAMRGGEMDDLIFSGSAGRPARETAEVTLVLDNADRTAPPEFNSSDTLEVLRRLKRGSGSTYKLNGRTVRGKDIQLLFADASTGANSPSLVRQGQISELIGSKPQNRRRILEEAAGISGLNTRRHEAELKLRGAETNLERLSEVSAEVERQLASLKRQASKARRYKTLSAEIAALDAWAAHLKWVAAKDARETSRARLDEIKREVEELTRADAIAEKERIEASEKLAPLREAESIAAAKLGQSRIQLARLEAERKAAADALARLQGEADRLEEDMQREQQMKDEAETAAARAKDELAALPTLDAGQSDAQEQAAREAVEAARAKLREAEEKADAIGEQLAEARAARRAASANAEAQRNRKQQLESQATRLRDELAGVANAAALTAATASAREAETAAEQRLQAAEAALEAADADLAAKRETETEAEAPKAEAEKLARALEAEIAGLQRLLRKADGPSAPPVLDRIRTHEGYEKAIAAALGDDLQASTDRSSALFWAGAEGSDQSLPDGAEPLTDYADAPGELSARLAQCGVVDADDGERLANQLKPGQRLVSKAGHLWRWDGFVRTPAAPVSAAEKLEQQARLEAAQADLGPARQALSDADRTLSEARGLRKAAEEELRGLRGDVQPAARALSEARTTAQSAAQSFERAAMKRDAGQEALARVEGDLEIAIEALKLIDPVGEAGDDTALEAELTMARTDVAEAREAETEARGRLTDLTRGREQAEKRRDGLTRDLEEWAHRAEASGQRFETLLKRRADARASLAGADLNPDETAGEIDMLRASVDDFETDRKAAADEFALAETAFRDAERAARTANTDAQKSRENLIDAKVRIETAEERFAEIVEFAQTQFERTPEGLAALARAGLEEEELETLELRETEQRADGLKRTRDGLGGVNMDAEAEAEELGERLGTQVSEKEDLIAAIAKLREGVASLNDEGRVRLIEAFEKVNEHFKSLFTALFRGGQAELRLVDADDPLNAGLEIFAQPPGKKLGTLNLMSGGEQALTAAALIFAVFLSNPAPICVLDEVDAPLDDANVDRFCNMLNEMRQRTDTRFVVITHNPVTMSRMDRLFGVTMREKGVSKLVSVDLSAAAEMVAA